MPLARSVRHVALAITWLGLAAQLGAQVRLSGSMGALLAALPFVVWAALPFGVAFMGLSKRDVSMGRAVGLASTSALGLLMYGDLLFTSRLSSTDGLAFLFIPLWQLIACGVALAVTVRRVKRAA